MARKKRPAGVSLGAGDSFASEGQRSPFVTGEAEVQYQMFRSLADRSQEFIGMCDLAFKPFYVNEAGRKLVGLDSLEQACAVKVQDFFFPEDQRCISEEFFPKVLREGRGEVEIRFRHFKTGAALWKIYNVFQVRDAQGRVGGYATVSRDITEQKRAGEALRTHRELLETVVNSLPLHLSLIRGSDLRIQLFNPAYQALAPGKEMLGKTLDEIWPEAGQNFAGLCRHVLETGEPYHVEDELNTIRRWPEGPLEERYFSWSLYRVRLPGEESWAILNPGWETTARVRAQAALREAHQRLKYHTQNTPLAVIEFDAELRVSAWTDGAQRVFGWEASEVLGKLMFDIPWLLEDDQPRVRAVAAGMYSGQIQRCVSPNRNVRKDGRVIWCEWYNSALTDSTGKMQSLQSLVLDVTERKEAEAVLARSKEELEQLVAERTAKLQELVGELEHFSYTITHDLKSPLRAMRGFAEMARLACGECERSDGVKFLERIATSAERMDRLIADALNYSQSVRQELPLEDVDAGKLLRGMLDSYPELQPEKARIRVERRLPIVLANEAGLTQCFSNLLGNAVKFVKAGEVPDIRVWSELLPSAQRSTLNTQTAQWVRIWIEDEGIGISKEMLPRVFNMFSRGSKSYEGTGIGLALVRKVVHRMGGRVGVESEEGEGSRFWLELKTGEMRAAAKAEVVTNPAPGGGTVLYVEDEESDAMFMDRAFASKGLGPALRVVDDGRAAIDYLSGAGKYGDRQKYPLPTVVLLDLNLPQVPGFEVLRWMRNHPDFTRTPVVVFSSSTREEDRMKAQELGANEFVPKPNSGLKFGDVVEGLKDKWLKAAG
jgi:PAS domain S-box-containing protein